MPIFLGVCSTRRTNLFSWFFGGSAAPSKLTVNVSAQETHHHTSKRGANTPYNLRPRRTIVDYKEAEEESDASEEA